MRFFIAIYLVLQCLCSFAISKYELVESGVEYMEFFDAEMMAEDAVLLKTPYASSKISNPQEAKKVVNQAISSITLVFTDFQRSESFKQKQLNHERLDALEKLIPGVFEQPDIEWFVIGQTGGDDIKAASKLFHGFIINYTEISSAAEADLVEDYMTGRLPSTATLMEMLKVDEPVVPVTETVEVPEVEPEPAKDTLHPKFKTGKPDEVQTYFNSKFRSLSYVATEGLSGSMLVKVLLDKKGILKNPEIIQSNIDAGGKEAKIEVKVKKILSLMRWKPGKIDKKPAEFDYMLNVTFENTEDGKISNVASVGPFKMPEPPKPEVEETEVVEVSEMSTDSALMKYPKPLLKRFLSAEPTVTEAMARNTDWDSIVIVSDVTAGMGGYTVQVLEFIKNQSNDSAAAVAQLVFLNDGNGIADKVKKVGVTGGLFEVKPTEGFETVLRITKQAMTMGDGGDQQENYVEAILRAEALCPDCSAIVLVADNTATARDLKLAEKINKPLAIITCGGFEPSKGWQNMAELTGASLHTLKEDF